MHDPDTVAFEIPGPWLRRWHRPPGGSTPRWGLVRRRRTNPENLGEPVFPWWRLTGWRGLANGIEWHWGRLVTIWHHEPGDRDSGEVCKHYRRWQNPDGSWDHKPLRGWKWHVHHWRLQVPPLQAFRRWALTRCEWCGGRSRKGDVVNFSRSWYGEESPWWRGERGLFHEDCHSINGSHLTCTCPTPGTLEHGDWGKCEFCGLFRVWQSIDTPAEDTARTFAVHDLLKSVPHGQRDAAVTAEVRRMWAEARGVA